MNRHRERSFDWKSIPLVDWKSIPLTAHFCVMSVYVMFATGPQAILSFAFASLTLVASCDGYCAVGHLCVCRFVVAFLVASSRLLRSASTPLVHKSRGLYLHRPS